MRRASQQLDQTWKKRILSSGVLVPVIVSTGPASANANALLRFTIIQARRRRSNRAAIGR